jgi:hypothetical protein
MQTINNTTPDLGAPESGKPAPKKSSGPIVRRHCPRCWAVRSHTRSISNGAEVLTCSVCGNPQVYRLGPRTEKE